MQYTAGATIFYGPAHLTVQQGIYTQKKSLFKCNECYKRGSMGTLEAHNKGTYKPTVTRGTGVVRDIQGKT